MLQWEGNELCQQQAKLAESQQHAGAAPGLEPKPAEEIRNSSCVTSTSSVLYHSTAGAKPQGRKSHEIHSQRVQLRQFKGKPSIVMCPAHMT